MESYSEEPPVVLIKRWRTSFYGVCRFEGCLRIRNYVCNALTQDDARQVGLRRAQLELFGVRVLEDPAEEADVAS
jgi:hypothetical protein